MLIFNFLPCIFFCSSVSVSVCYKAQEIARREAARSEICSQAYKALPPLSCGMPQFPSLQQGGCTSSASWVAPFTVLSLTWNSHGIRRLSGSSAFPALLPFSAASGGERFGFRLGESQQKFAGWQQDRFICLSQLLP